MDLTHGGSTLALEYKGRGAEVSVVDCYRTAEDEVKRKLASAGVEYLEEAPERRFDLAVIPIHCPDSFLGKATYGRKITAHQAVGELCSFEAKIIEVTGTRGKTSTCHAIAHILKELGASVMLLSSRGIFHIVEKTERIEQNASIAPPSILRIWKMRREFDFGVFEVSLGGTGLAEIGVITSIEGNYPIAAATRNAFEGKALMASSVTRSLVVREKEKDLWLDHVDEGVGIVTFGEGGAIDVKATPPLSFEKSVMLDIYTDGGYVLSVETVGSYLVPSYLPAFSAAVAVAVEAGAELKDSVASLASFTGIPGRGEVSKDGDAWIVRERNPGVTASTIDYTIAILRDYYGFKKMGVVVEPTTRKVCEKLDIGAFEEVVASRRDCVTGGYLFYRGNDEVRESQVLKRIDSVSNISGRHDAVIWCTKEAFQ